MDINKNQTISVSEANRNFSYATLLAEKNGTVYIVENDKPKFKLVDMEHDTSIEMTDDEKIDFVAARVLREYRQAFEELAK